MYSFLCFYFLGKTCDAIERVISLIIRFLFSLGFQDRDLLPSDELTKIFRI